MEALEDVQVQVGGYVGDDVDSAESCCGGLLPGIDGMESEEGVWFAYSDEALAMALVDYKPRVLYVRIEAHGVDQFARPEVFAAAEGKVRI